jgi:hypothetical protein
VSEGTPTPDRLDHKQEIGATIRTRSGGATRRAGAEEEVVEGLAELGPSASAFVARKSEILLGRRDLPQLASPSSCMDDPPIMDPRTLPRPRPVLIAALAAPPS